MLPAWGLETSAEAEAEAGVVGSEHGFVATTRRYALKACD